MDDGGMNEAICSREMAKSQRSVLSRYVFFLLFHIFLCAIKSSTPESTTRNGLIEIACIEFRFMYNTVDCCAFFWCAIKIENGPKIDGLKLDAETVRERPNTNSQLSNYFVGQTECAQHRTKEPIQTEQPNEHDHFQWFHRINKRKWVLHRVAHWLPDYTFISPYFYFSLFYLKAEDSIC